MTWTPFDEYMNEKFKRYCPDSARFLNSRNPIAKKHAEEDRFFFTVGMLIRNNFDDDEIMEWDLAIANTLCPKCPGYDPNEPCEDDPGRCEYLLKLEEEYLASTYNQEVRKSA